MTKTWTRDEVAGWFAGRIPDGWFTGAPDLRIDRAEVQLVGELADPQVGDGGEDARHAARASRADAFRERTRADRMAIAADAESLWGRKVSWGVRVGGEEHLFTTASVPVMTRLRLAERQVLDTLIDAGVARTNSDAVAWCVRLVGRHEREWIDQLREAVAAVREVREEGPGADRGPS